MEKLSQLTPEQRQLLKRDPRALLRQIGVKPVEPPKQDGPSVVTYRP